MTKTIIFVHGRSFKPNRTVLRRLWLDATCSGIKRDRPRKAAAFRSVRKDFAYYGHLSNDFLFEEGRQYDETADIADREVSLKLLKIHQKHQFTKKTYRKLHGKTPLKEFFADAFAGPAFVTGLSGVAIRSVAPDMAHYWDMDSEFGSQVRKTMTEQLSRAMNRNDKIMVVAHSLGTMVAYDTFWKFSRMSEYEKYFNKKIDLFVTIGSPLGDETVKRNLRGAGAKGPRRYPSNIKEWVNVAAEDDYISHDQRIGNDYKRMRKLGTKIRDSRRIYNLAVRNGDSNPHSSLGYLMHPTVVKLIANWI